MSQAAPGTPTDGPFDPPTPPISEPELRTGFALFESDNHTKKRYIKNYKKI